MAPLYHRPHAPARREFLLHGGLLATGAAVIARPGGATRADEPADCSTPAPPGNPVLFKPDTNLPVRTRRNLAKIMPTDPYVNKLKAAYQELRKLYKSKPNDPRGWLQQANVHCWYCSGGDMAAGEEIHGSWWFFPWHRCYLYFHERILGKLIGDKNFALPYWDWVDAGQRTLPDFYTNPNDVSNPLFDANRKAKPADKIPDVYVGSAVMGRVMGQPTADLFMGTDASLPRSAGGRLENGPHGAVHLFVGDPQTLAATPDMGVLATAAQDPVFFAHHANIDRLWDVWLNASATHQNPQDARWLSHPWTFYDEEGKWTSITVRDVLDHEKKLRYRYEGAQPVAEKITLTSRPHTITVPVPAEPAPVYVLHIDGVEVPPDKSSVVRVFVGLPEAKAETSTNDSSHYVGYFTILAKTSKSGKHHKGHPNTSVTLDLPADVANALKGKADVKVTLVPVTGVSNQPKETNLTYEQVRITAVTLTH